MDLEKNGMIQHPVLTFLFVLTAAILLAVVIMNLLIGLAVGDIDKIRQNALVKQRADEIRLFTKLDNRLPLFFLQRFNVRFIENYPNRDVNFVRTAWRLLWRTFKGDEEDTNDTNDLQHQVEEQKGEIKALENKIEIMSAQHSQQHEELRQMMETIISQTLPNRDDTN